MARVLLIEPDYLSAKIYCQALETTGHTVEACSTAQAAIHAANDRYPDVVVLELQLVNHGGIEFLYEFRTYADWQAIPVVIHTHIPPGEFAGSRQLLRSELGVERYLYKPQTNLKQLVRSVDELLSVK